MVPHLPLLQTTPRALVGHWALDVKLIAGHKVSVLPTADDQALWAQWPAVIPFILKPPKMVRYQAASLIPSKMRESVLRKRTTPMKVRVGSRPQVMIRRHPMVKISRSALTPRTPSPVLVSSLASMRTPTLSPTLERKSRQHGKSSARTVPRRTAPTKTPVDHHLPRKSRQPTRHSEMGLGKKCSCLTHTLMLGVMTKLPIMSRAG